MAKKQKAIRAYELPLTTRAAILGELQLRAALPLDTEVMRAVTLIRKDTLYSDGLSDALRYLSKDFVRSEGWRLEHLPFEQLQLWLEMRRAWVLKISHCDASGDCSFGTRPLPASVVCLFGFRREHGDANELIAYERLGEQWSLAACVQNAADALCV
jgi:hypothetical protein